MGRQKKSLNLILNDLTFIVVCDSKLVQISEGWHEWQVELVNIVSLELVQVSFAVTQLELVTDPVFAEQHHKHIGIRASHDNVTRLYSNHI